MTRICAHRNSCAIWLYSRVRDLSMVDNKGISPQTARSAVDPADALREFRVDVRQEKLQNPAY